MIVFRRCLQPLGKLVSLEMGKIVPEGVGEVQVGIDREGCGRGPGRDCSRGEWVKFRFRKGSFQGEMGISK